MPESLRELIQSLNGTDELDELTEYLIDTPKSSLSSDIEAAVQGV